MHAMQFHVILDSDTWNAKEQNFLYLCSGHELHIDEQFVIRNKYTRKLESCTTEEEESRGQLHLGMAVFRSPSCSTHVILCHL